jgi:hypothetical protein
MRKLIWILPVIMLLIQSTQAQSLYSSNQDSLLASRTDHIPDPAEVESMNPQKPLWVPVIEGVGLNVGLAAFNAYLMNSEFAKISFTTVKHNFEIGYTTDADAFSGNMFSHPFHGSIYYNLSRSSGFDYWTSMGVATFGSWQWEFFMENEPPALNDWIMTSVSGSMIGEIFYRFSNLILDESLSGASRVWNEIGAGVFNPGRLFNRLINGRTSRVTSAKLYEKRIVLGELGFGMNNVANGTDFDSADKNGMFTIDYAYGRLFKSGKIKPLDFFRWNLAVNFGGVQPAIGQFRIYGILHGKKSNMGHGKFLWGVFQHYDFLESNVYQIGATSVGLGIGYRDSGKGSVSFVGILHGAALLMGGVNSEYANNYKVSFLDSARTYNMGPGAHAKMETFLRFSFGSLYLGYSLWWIHTWDGAPGDEIVGMLSPKLRIRVYDRWYLGLEYLYYHKVGLYDDYDNTDTRNNEQRLFVAYSF